MAESVLEDVHRCVMQAARLLRDLQQENAHLKELIQRLRENLEETQQENRKNLLLIERFENDRLLIRSRIRAILDKMHTQEEVTKG